MGSLWAVRGASGAQDIILPSRVVSAEKLSPKARCESCSVTPSSTYKFAITTRNLSAGLQRCLKGFVRGSTRGIPRGAAQPDLHTKPWMPGRKNTLLLLVTEQAHGWWIT
ncbi:hypothetical protein NDU88_005276 [Pleurodeles waltl]|uniref:Uncharacterized protein n=1 Tax=Pleurodeles waltl TaxID=8319 RepID=A0AAV7UHJ8_PLEWA|nr:hypothetical protein NDU88_005276 [Pleurodeles waltl]